MRRTSSSHCGLHVTQTVAHKRHILHIDTKTVCNLLQQTGQRLSAGAGVFWRVRAIKNGVDATTQSGKLFHHAFVNGIQGSNIQQAAAQARLVGGQYDVIARMVEAAHSF